MKKALLFMLAAGAMCLASCQKGEGPDVSTPGRITIEPVITRATEVNFEDGDKIGLTITKEDASPHATNQLLTYGGSVFTCDLTWYSEAYTESRLVAYYPYSPAGAPTTFTVATDQTSTGYGESDLMGASKAGVRPSANAISMTFKHLLTNVVINMENESGSDITSVTLSGAIPTANVDLENLSVEVDDAVSAADLIAQEVVAGEQYRLIVVPQTVAFTLTVVTSGGATLSQNLLPADLIQGKQYTVDVRVTADNLLVSLSGDIENWGEGGKLQPDNGGSGEVDFEEFTGYFVYHGETYQTVTLANGSTWMAEPLRYIPVGYTPSADPTTDSHIWYPYKLENDNGMVAAAADRAVALTDETSITKYGYLYDFSVALGGVDITETNCYDFEGVQGICPAGWHIPTRADFFGLCGLSSKNALGESGNQVDNTALFYDQGYGGGMLSLYDAAGWNYVRSGTRMQSTFTGTPSYQLTQLYTYVDTNNATKTNTNEEYGAIYGYESIALTYILSSTCYQPSYSSGALSNIQFFAQMTTFTTSYPAGRISLSYLGIKSGTQIRCVKD